MANAAKVTAVNTDIGASAFVSPTAPNKKVILSALASKGVLTASGAYAAGKGQADLGTLFAVRDPVTEILASIVAVVYGV